MAQTSPNGNLHDPGNLEEKHFRNGFEKHPSKPLLTSESIEPNIKTLDEKNMNGVETSTDPSSFPQSPYFQSPYPSPSPSPHFHSPPPSPSHSPHFHSLQTPNGSFLENGILLHEEVDPKIQQNTKEEGGQRPQISEKHQVEKEDFNQNEIFFVELEDKDRVVVPYKENGTQVNDDDDKKQEQETEEEIFYSQEQLPTLQTGSTTDMQAPPTAEAKPKLAEILVFVNKRSGSNQGQIVFDTMSKICGANRVFDLSPNFDLQKLRETFDSIPSSNDIRVIVAGGDGTIAWALSLLESVKLSHIPVATLPIGIGNEMSAILGWGSSNINDLVLYIDQVCKNQVIPFDRWTVKISPLAESDANNNTTTSTTTTSTTTTTTTTTSTTTTDSNSPNTSCTEQQTTGGSNPTIPNAKGTSVVVDQPSPSSSPTTQSAPTPTPNPTPSTDIPRTPPSSPLKHTPATPTTNAVLHANKQLLATSPQPPTPSPNENFLSPSSSPRNSPRSAYSSCSSSTSSSPYFLSPSSSPPPSNSLSDKILHDDQHLLVDSPTEGDADPNLQGSTGPTNMPASPSVSSPSLHPTNFSPPTSASDPSFVHISQSPFPPTPPPSVANRRRTNTILPPVLSATRDDMLCFFSIGFDANISLQFHELRETKPYLCMSRGINKFWHVRFGIQCLFAPRLHLSSCVELWVDGVHIIVPETIQTLQVFNIHSSADGVDFFGLQHGSTDDDLLKEYSQPTVNDGLLEVVGTDSLFHMLLMRTSLKHAHRLAQGRHIRILYKGEDIIAVQHDGQPSWRGKCEINIRHKNQISMVLGAGPTRGVG